MVPFVYYFLKVTSNLDHRRQILDLSNEVQEGHNANFLATLLCSTVCLSSHCNGIEGVMLDKFLLDLIFQLQNAKVNHSDIAITGLEKLEGHEIKIPFQSPPNMEWPAYLGDIPNSNFGNLKRTFEEDAVEILTDSMISGESKDCAKGISLLALRKILRRIPKIPNYIWYSLESFENTIFEARRHFPKNLQSIMLSTWRISRLMLQRLKHRFKA